MSGRIIFLTEEESMEHVIRNLLPNFFPDFRENEHWLVISHRGKSDLERSFPRRLREWKEPDARFIILRDNDGADCSKLKQDLVSMVPLDAPKYLIRLVCQELESWLLGDPKAIGEAYPSAARKGQFKTLSKKDPDQLSNASDLVNQLTGTKAKIVRATEIAKKMRPGLNQSKSFQTFLRGLSDFLSESTNPGQRPGYLLKPKTLRRPSTLIQKEKP